MCFLRVLIFLLEALSIYFVFCSISSDSPSSYSSEASVSCSWLASVWDVYCSWSVGLASEFELDFSLSTSTDGSALSSAPSPAFPIASAEWGSRVLTWAPIEAFTFLWCFLGWDSTSSYSGFSFCSDGAVLSFSSSTFIEIYCSLSYFWESYTYSVFFIVLACFWRWWDGICYLLAVAGCSMSSSLDSWGS